MADFDSSLPIRTENDGDVVIKVADATITSQQLKVNADGSVDVNFAPGNAVEITDGTDTLAINADGSINATVTATDLDIRDLDSAQDSVEVLQATHDNLNANANLQVGNADVANGNPVPVSDAGGSLTVDAVNLDIRDLAFATDKVDVSGSSVTVSATDLDIRDLTHASDSVKVGDGTDFLAVNTDGSINITDNGGSITVDGSVTVSATDLDIRNLVFATDKVDVSGSSVTVTATDLDVRDIDAAQDNIAISDGTDTLGINADGSINAIVTATNLDIRDLTHVSDSVKIGDGTDFLAVNTDGSINVKIADGSPGTAINSYNTAAAVAGGASSTHTYTSTGNFYLTQIEATGSGKVKIEVTVNGTTRFVQFNSTSSPNMTITLTQPILATTGQTVTVVRTNRDNQAQDLYSTILGYNE